MIYLLSLESLEERYTEQWARWIPKALQDHGHPFVNVLGQPLTKTIEVGDVLDVYGTNYWKMTQMSEFIKLCQEGCVKDGDTVWVADLWYPGLQVLGYIRSMTKIDFKITGVLHAGTWDRTDFTVRNLFQDWSLNFEKSIFDIADTVFLGSEYHKTLILDWMKHRCVDELEYYAFEAKLKVTGLFFDAVEVASSVPVKTKQKNLVVFPHRLAPEKHPELFDKLEKELPEFAFVKTKEVTTNKRQYYELLAQAQYAVSFEGQETFGYAILECMALGVTPLVFNGMSYKETVPSPLRWDTWEELIGKFMDRLQVPLTEISLFEQASRFSPYIVAEKMFGSRDATDTI